MGDYGSYGSAWNKHMIEHPKRMVPDECYYCDSEFKIGIPTKRFLKTIEPNYKNRKETRNFYLRVDKKQKQNRVAEWFRDLFIEKTGWKRNEN